ncbi:MAG TPA: GNAT family N-acetyltransferase [Anaerolineales bacterium]|nr:GNAT family N-acetyltransferase [Anaerolineales bacterium]
MQIKICEITFENQFDFGACHMSFMVDSRLVVFAEEGNIRYTVRDVTPPYIKNYGPRRTDYAEYGKADDRMIFLAYVNDEIAGEVRITTSWNKYGLLDDFVVDPKFRRQGVGRALIQRCIEWAKEKSLPGLTLETQDINVPACRLYERCGFQLRGFDTHLYKALHPDTTEIALYWYLLF